MVAKQYWHYTVFERLQSIVSEGMINTADTWVSRKVKRVVFQVSCRTHYHEKSIQFS